MHTPRAGERHWLLIKERDAYVQEGAGTRAYPDDSIYSGLEVDELPRAAERARELAERAQELGAEERRLTADDVAIMKATSRDEPFDDPAWVFELKYDGYRIVAGRDEGTAVLVSRNGNDLTGTFPEVARAVEGLLYDGLVLDGEVVVHDERGLPSFGRLQKRGRLQNRRDIARAALELPAVYYAFDLLGLEGLDLRGLSLLERKELLREVLPSVGPVRYSEHIAERGEAMYRQVVGMRLEGLVAKKADSRYTGGRSRLWTKIRAVRSDDFVVVGWTEPSGSRAGFGALHLGQYEKGELVYMGSVGTGFSDAQLQEIGATLADAEVEEPPVAPPRTAEDEGGPLPSGAKHHWTEPRMVVEVQYREITEAGLLRHSVFLRLRDDKPPEECRRGEDDLGAGELPEPEEVETAPEKSVPFTNLEKVFWPEGEGGYTKGDLIEYYERISPWLLPWLEDRPLVLTRYPDGIHGKSFYQKDAPVWAPDWIRTVSVWSESSGRELNYFVAEDVETLLYLANLGTIPLHVWHSRIESLARPDWCLLDLDP
ncbi:MAG TPA: DNA ligase D, partial [Longimicrobiales bacterium]|nr:DNA ligase D [Longimicrobiales bacterium]